MNQTDKLHPIHPGEILLEEFLKPMKISQNELALAMQVPARRINEIVLSKRRITVDTALRLAHYFGNSAQFWLGLQMDYDLDRANQEFGEQLTKEVQSRCVKLEEKRTRVELNGQIWLKLKLLNCNRNWKNYA